MTVGVVTVAVGEMYLDRLETWATAVAQLNRQPDLITIVTDRMPRRYVEILDDLLPQWQLVTSEKTWERHPQILVNDAIAMTDTEWICKMDADDQIFQHALNPLDNWPTDVCMFGISVNGERNLIPSPVTAQQVLESPHNPLFAGSPFRRAIYEQTLGFRDIIYDDWAFWRDCARAGATFQPTNTIDYLYLLHGGNSSLGVDHAAETARVFHGSKESF
jgi:hypothetical protein